MVDILPYVERLPSTLVGSKRREVTHARAGGVTGRSNVSNSSQSGGELVDDCTRLLAAVSRCNVHESSTTVP